MALVAFSLRPPTGKAPISSSDQQSDETSNGRSKEQAKEKKGEGEKLVEGRKGEGATTLLPVPPAEGALADGSNNVKKRYDPSKVKKAERKKIHFAAGCFWSVELVFQRQTGVAITTVGYTQGKIESPTYEDVKTGKSGHAEAVEVTYDPKLTSLEKLLEVFWNKHDATSKNKQGNDKGTQYRSGIYYFDDEQKIIIDKSIEEQKQKLDKPWHKIHTEVKKASKFTPAEDYHQQYLEKGGRNGEKQSAMKGCTDPIRCYG
ncbi:hypothetical protein TL16_g02209 [Triparma laevis f. inornata]|uniref:peptide-methionine (S)-S-oxide reductase n=2 Tax=Triparma laevis TaxID=1534972 RepID=A0A9W6Z9Z8_9STRA|nr:hypothetical protein TrLO_g4541 [Triparma laevis f. longispina]GMH56749.1 hypothetical protein TL16_g02209 [Triparma laevis f. inornata]